MLRCSKEAFAKCPTRHLCGSPEEATFAENSECAKFNALVAEQPLSNGDRIRCMSDEQLAEYFATNTDEFCKNLPECGELLDADMHIPEEMCKACVLKWLKEPAEESLPQSAEPTAPLATSGA